jgi:leader peptidase (prepilin peptidase)/N-methyltransferase
VTAQALVGLVCGLGAGLVAAPLVRRLPRGIPERVAQPAWTRRAGHPVALAGAGAVAGLVVGLVATDPAALAVGLVLVAVLVPACAIDVAWRVVPDSLVAAGGVGSLAALALLDPGALGGHLAAAALGGAVALALAVAARGGLGLGDVKLVAMLGCALGAALPLALGVALLAAGLAALPILIARGRGATLPLVPFLALGALAVAGAAPSAAVPLP